MTAILETVENRIATDNNGTFTFNRKCRNVVHNTNDLAKPHISCYANYYDENELLYEMAILMQTHVTVVRINEKLMPQVKGDVVGWTLSRTQNR